MFQDLSSPQRPSPARAVVAQAAISRNERIKQMTESSVQDDTQSESDLMPLISITVIFVRPSLLSYRRSVCFSSSRIRSPRKPLSSCRRRVVGHERQVPTCTVHTGKLGGTSELLSRMRSVSDRGFFEHRALAFCEFESQECRPLEHPEQRSHEGRTTTALTIDSVPYERASSKPPEVRHTWV